VHGGPPRNQDSELTKNQGIRPHRIEITELIDHQASTSSKGI
jgi:hypothetical protein